MQVKPVLTHDVIEHRIGLEEIDPCALTKQLLGPKGPAVRAIGNFDPEHDLGDVFGSDEAGGRIPGARARERYQQHEPLVAPYGRDLTAPFPTDATLLL